MFIHITSPKGQGRLPVTNRGLTFLKTFAKLSYSGIMFIAFTGRAKARPFLFHPPFLFYVSFIIVKIIPYKCHPTQLNPKLQITLTLRGGLVSVSMLVSGSPQCRAECLHANACVSHVKIWL